MVVVVVGSGSIFVAEGGLVYIGGRGGERYYFAFSVNVVVD
jgi:hypothetical protein